MQARSSLVVEAKPFSKKMDDLAGKKFSNLLVMHYLGVNYRGKAVWKCACDCGVERPVAAQHLTQKNAKSCGEGEPHYQRLYPAGAFERLMTDVMPEPNSGCWLWMGEADGGYGVVHWGERRIKAHRVSYEYHKGKIPDGLIVRHKCDVRCCVNPDHLEIGTHQDNSDDMVKRQRSSRGEKHCRAQLTESQVRWIREALRGGEGRQRIAAALGVSANIIHLIANGKSWRHVT